jgi:hypothetical protein
MSSKVHVHAWEYVNGSGAEAQSGGGGFDWYWEPETAQASFAFHTGRMSPAEAHFLFSVDVPEETLNRGPQHVTYLIDGRLHDLCVTAAERKVGADVLAYWSFNSMKMGQ